MRIAVYSDIHGNTPALAAVHHRIDAIDGIDLEICLGDLFYGGPGSQEIIRRIQDRRVMLLRGNHEEDLRKFPDVLPTLPPTHRHTAARWHEWLMTQITEPDIEYLSTLPMSHQAVFPDGTTALFCHSSPTNTNIKLLGPDAPIENRTAVFETLNVNVLCNGHWHEQAFWRWKSLQVVCVGSIGLSPDGLSRWILIESDKHSVRFLPQITPYDVGEFNRLVIAANTPRLPRAARDTPGSSTNA